MTLDLSTARDRSSRDNLAEAARPGAPPSGDCVAALEEPAASQEDSALQHAPLLDKHPMAPPELLGPLRREDLVAEIGSLSPSGLGEGKVHADRQNHDVLELVRLPAHSAVMWTEFTRADTRRRSTRLTVSNTRVSGDDNDWESFAPHSRWPHSTLDLSGPIGASKSCWTTPSDLDSELAI